MKKLILSAVIAAAASSANAGEVSLGLTSSYSPAVYKGLDSNVEPFPFIGYQGDQFYIEGVELGYHLVHRDAPLNLIFRVAYDPRTLKPEDSDDADIKLLDERKAGALGGVTLQHKGAVGTLQATVGTSLNNTETGYYGELVWKHHINRGFYGLIPEIGYAYNSEELNDHLYGVSAEEASRTRFDEFHAGNSGKMFVGLGSYAYLSKSLRLTLSARYTKLDSEIADSPIVRRDDALSGTFGVSYIF
ncbi:MipA/OmpV family protein [Photobacterium sp. SDRW27]|uniref:MipA/OmpV family protein n=1 Tax=Photobacterium obscurum TaxID=2829490 RepID=UPI002243C7EC|nr:MipA/OmpV family protein [Photobacterium obscurum]MCW8331902.1 MipA/OmpV family protein [Photobacterium obscurum]